LLPRDPNDERNLFIEVRPALVATSRVVCAELFRMYARSAERKRWQ